jgi:hypothetical protein
MAVRLSALRNGQSLLPRNIIIFLVFISVRGYFPTKELKRKKNLVMGPKGVLETKVDRPTDRRSQYQLTTNYRPALSSEREPQEEQSNCPAKERKEKNLVMGCPTPRRIGRLTVGHNMDSTQRSPELHTDQSSARWPQRLDMFVLLRAASRTEQISTGLQTAGIFLSLER